VFPSCPLTLGDLAPFHLSCKRKTLTELFSTLLIASTLNGSLNAVIPLMTGITLTGPGPVFPSTKILAFNIIDSMSEEVFSKDETPTFPSTDSDEYTELWAPIASNPEADQQYADVKDKWSSPAWTNGPEGTFGVFKTLLGWSEVVSLKTDAPKLALQSLEQVYATPPLLGQAAA
jgi:hypothetical protein